MHLNDDKELGEYADILEDVFTEEGLTQLQNSIIPLLEEFHGRLAVEFTMQAKIFRGDNEQWTLDSERKSIATATGDDLRWLMDWWTHMDRDVNAQNQGSDSALAELEQTYASGVVTRLDEGDGDSGGTVSLVSSDTTTESLLPSVDPLELNSDQFCAYDIITWHLNQTLMGSKPPPLQMMVHGKGGTGKSQVIQTVTDYLPAKVPNICYSKWCILVLQPPLLTAKQHTSLA